MYLRELAGLFDDIQASVFSGNTAAVTTSKYKSCESENTGHLNIQRSEYAERARLKIEKEYSVCLEQMKMYVERYLRISDREYWLGHALLELLEKDQTIGSEEKFYFMSDGSSISKSAFLKDIETEICFPAFLLGLWYYIIDHQVKNTEGFDTYISWHNQGKKFVSEIGKSYPRRTFSMDIINLEEQYRTNSVFSFNKEDFSANLEKMDTALSSQSSERMLRYANYLRTIQGKHNKVKTLLYADEPTDFYSFYVCNHLRRKVYTKQSGTYSYQIYQDITVEKLREISNCVIISGVGGLGKTMMMKHLLMSAASVYKKTEILPVLVPLKDYRKEKTLVDFIYERVEASGLQMDKIEFLSLLTSSSCLLLLDGYDEIRNDERDDFDTAINLFMNEYSDNQFVISSRPAYSFIHISQPTVLELCPLTKEQAMCMVGKLQYDQAIKTRFIQAIDEKLYQTHRQFIGNPLLLTITLMTYERFAEIPDKKHLFYREAYETLATKHDATKGAYKRELNTKLSLDRFEKYLSEFCARTYREEKFEFNDFEIQHFFESMNLVKKNNPEFSYTDFRDDIKDKICLIYQDGDVYLFIHRSFQEYFCALYFSRQKDKYLKKIGDFFNQKSNRHDTDQTFEMLYHMIKSKVEEYMFFPYLTELIQKCEREKDYWTFLQEIYPCINYSYGETAYDYENRPNQYLYEFIGKENDLLEGDPISNLPFDEGLVVNRYMLINGNWDNPDEGESWDLVDEADVDELYIDRYGEPDIEGYNLEVEISEIIDNPDSYLDFVEVIEHDSFPLKKEYQRLLKYYQELCKLYKKKDGEDLFDGLE